jgi:ABC-type polar amino acid transport system ATPase subunit
LTGEVLNVIRQLAEDGMTMIVVTHEMEFARKVATKVVFIENGEIVEENNSKDFFERPQMERTKEFVYKSSTWISDQRSGI